MRRMVSRNVRAISTLVDDLREASEHLNFLRLRGGDSDARADDDHPFIYAPTRAYPHALNCRYWIALVGNRRTSVAG
jgi:hypothetical protein